MSAQDRDTPPRLVTSQAWTGRLPEPVVRPPSDAAHRGRLVTAGLLMGAILAAWVAWLFVLSLHAPSVPDPLTGRTEALRLRQQGGSTLYVRPWEAAVSHGLAIAAFILPAARLAWGAVRRHGKQ